MTIQQQTIKTEERHRISVLRRTSYDSFVVDSNAVLRLNICAENPSLRKATKRSFFYSIIIPLYNRPQEIEELLETLTHQTYQNFEIIVIEDGSTLDSKRIVNQYVNKLNLKYFFKENSGQGFSRNYGFEKANGDYFIIFDSDCLIPKDYLMNVNSALNGDYLDAFGGPDAAHSSFTNVQQAISYSMTSLFTTGGIRGNKKHLGQFHPRSFNMGISKEVFQKLGGFAITRMGEDIEYSIRIHRAGFRIGLIANAVVFHKRRTNFVQFFKQLHFFGRARINIYTFYPNELKLVHFFPAIFTIFLSVLIVNNIFGTFLACIGNLFLGIYLLLIFCDAWLKNKSFYVAFLSIFASIIQLSAYGIGFMQEFFKRIILKRENQ